MDIQDEARDILRKAWDQRREDVAHDVHEHCGADVNFTRLPGETDAELRFRMGLESIQFVMVRKLLILLDVHKHKYIKRVNRKGAWTIE